MPWPLENSSWVSANESTHYSMRRRVVVHFESPPVAGKPHWMYIGSWETSVCLLRRVSSVVGRGANKSCEAAAVDGSTVSPSWVDANDARVASEGCGCVTVSAATNTRSTALWSALPPFAVLRITTRTDWHTALWWMIRRASRSGHSLEICAHESGL